MAQDHRAGEQAEMRPTPTRRVFGAVAGLIVALAAVMAIVGTASNAADGAKAEVIARGKYLVTIGGCNDCHTPWKVGPNGPEPDMSRMLSGHPSDLKMPKRSAPTDAWAIAVAPTFTAWSGPWGTTYTKNLTPDSLTGIGIWTEEIFVNAIRTGRHWGVARPIMPPMPWQNYRHLTDEDIKAVYAYLRTIPPIFNEVPEYEPPAEVTAGK